MTKAERIAKSEAARHRRKNVKRIITDRTVRLYSKFRRIRRKNSKTKKINN